jgi:hypothetical protein
VTRLNANRSHSHNRRGPEGDNKQRLPRQSSTYRDSIRWNSVQIGVEFAGPAASFVCGKRILVVQNIDNIVQQLTTPFRSASFATYIAESA